MVRSKHVESPAVRPIHVGDQDVRRRVPMGPTIARDKPPVFRRENEAGDPARQRVLAG